MKPVTQTRTGRPMGNCTEAAIASLLEVELDQVPQLWDPADTTDRDQRPKHRVDAFYEFIRSRGFVMAWGDLVEPIPLPLDPRRWTDGAHLLEGYHLLGGPQVGTEIPHMVVAHGGRVVWDPNPNRRGISAIDGIGWLQPIHELPVEMRDWPAVGLVFGDLLEAS